MTYHWSDNVHTTAFTPRDFQVELLAAAREKNIIICLGHNSSKEFIALKLLQERAPELRRIKNKKKSLYICSNGDSTYNLIFHLTDLKVANLNRLKSRNINWEQIVDENQILILNADLLLDALICSYIGFDFVNLVIIEECHQITGKEELDEIFAAFYPLCKEQPNILGLAGPLHSAACPPGRLGLELANLEKSLDCKAETASDIVTVLRYCSKPIEVILQCAPPKQCEVTNYLCELVITRKTFLNEHRFDPSEIYSDEFLEELQAIPDPKLDPIELLDQYLDVLFEMGPWCADRAALNLLMKIEKLKVKTPYERHFLLLCLISTTFVQIRAYCDYIFQQLPTEKVRIETYSTPKVLRILEVLRLFKTEPKDAHTFDRPNNNNQQNKNCGQQTTKILHQIDELDFKKISKNLTTLQENVDHTKSSESIALKEGIEKLLTKNDEQKPSNSQSPVKQRYRNRLNRPPYQRPRSHWNNQNDPDALCGLIFCNSKFIAKILFNLFYEMSKNDADLNYLGVQFTVDRTADPLTESKEAELEHRKQEEVLKRFRMHECNLLIGTSVLEEGIDLPKCNLVIRWDPPTTYRSYVQCKGRARAQNSYHIIMVASKISISDPGPLEFISDQSHQMICDPPKGFDQQIRSTKPINGIDTDLMNIENVSESSSDESNLPYFNGHIDNDKIDDENETDDDNNSSQNEDDCDIITLYDRYKCVVKKDESHEEDVIAVFKTKVSAELENNTKMEQFTTEIVHRLAEYMEIEKMLIRKCENQESPELESIDAEKFTACILSYKPLSDIPDAPSVNLSTAVALVNKYCAKLPSDTFTKLTPLWRCAKTERNGQEMFQYTVRLPINSPLKQDILGLPMPSRILARRIAALITCRVLHLSGELDDSLQPIGKEGFRATEPDWENFELEKNDEEIVYENLEPRPGTTKRRQYYYKRIASVFTGCRPSIGTESYLYYIKMTLQCPIPEEQNTRGRKIYPPEDATQGFGILTLKKIPKISSFPIFTRSGEVKVELELTKQKVFLNEHQLQRINTFINYTFTNVLRLQKYLMLFDAEAIDNSFFIVPTIKTDINNSNGDIEVDWNFLNLIATNSERMPIPIPDDVRSTQEFDPNKFKDAVVMPWYRNQDQPQYFYVAEICYHLSPESSFPGDNYKTFQEYYFRKYGITIQNCHQPLLDVDHTSARLNFLTPRYVNRKGVALPTSSEETKKAKRENLEQKQILVPELCTIHPFPASLWRAAVCLPCILYRINALLLADEIRRQVSNDLGLGKADIEDSSFEWPMLNFGWSLAEVLKKSRDAKLQSTDEEEKSTNIDSKEKIEELNENDKKEEIPSQEHDSSKSANDILDEADKKLKNECVMEIGTWSNEMAENIKMNYEDGSDEEWGGILPPNVNMCSSNQTRIRYGSPTWNNGDNSNLASCYYSDSEASYQSDDDFDIRSISSNDKGDGRLKIEFKSDNVAEAIETEEDIQKRQRKLEIINDINANEKSYQSTKNIGSGFDCFLKLEDKECCQSVEKHENDFQESIEMTKNQIRNSGMLVVHSRKLEIENRRNREKALLPKITVEHIHKLVPFCDELELIAFLEKKNVTQMTISLDDLYEIHRTYFERYNDNEKYIIEGTGDLFDSFNDSNCLEINNNQKELLIEREEFFRNRVTKRVRNDVGSPESQKIISCCREDEFSFDRQPDLSNHPGPSPSIILQALTMSNANDGINLERLETIGDSFLKYAITTYLYCTYENVHEGKLSHLRSKQVSNLNLYRLGRKKMFGESMIATKFEPHDNWLPPCYYVPRELEKALIEARIPACHWNLADLSNIKKLSSEEICKLVKIKAEALGLLDEDDVETEPTTNSSDANPDIFPCFIPYNLVTQHSIPDKSVADCVEALIGSYLIECGIRGALLFMAWLGIRVLPFVDPNQRPQNDDQKMIYGHWAPPKSPLRQYAPNPYATLEMLLDGYSVFEDAIGYHFKDRSYLLQAMTHASYSPNRLTDCYQRLEFLGDAVLDYLITRHLYEDPRQHSPGALTDLRSALVNNTIFASLAVRHGFHKYFRHLSPGLNEVIDRFVRIQHENGHSISEEFYLISEEECDEAEDVEVPKALGDVFESVAGAIFLDSNMSLDTVWKIYSNMMRPEIEQFSNSVPKSPIRELLELEPETAKFSKPEKLADGRRVRVTVEVFGKGTYRGIGRNYRIAKCTAAKCALRQLKKQGLITKRH